MHILALDVGTDSVRAGVLDAEHQQLLGPIAEVGTQESAASEIAPDELWSALTTAARHACRDFPGVAGVGLSVRTPSLVLLDKADRPLYSLWTAQNGRARPAARQTWLAVGNEFLSVTGSRPHPTATSAVSYRQQLNDDPYLCHRVHRFLHLSGWLGLRMTGEATFDQGNASCTGLFGTLTDRKWSARWCDYFEVDRAWLPPVVCGSTTIGSVRSSVAAELGVPAGIPLKLGTLNPGIAMLAANITNNELLHLDGDVQTLAALATARKPSAQLCIRLLGIGDEYIQIAYNPVGSSAIDWIHNACFREQSTTEFFEQILPKAMQHATGVLFDPPCLAGNPSESEACRAAFRDLTLLSGRDDLLAAVVQALARSHDKALKALGANRLWSRVVVAGRRTETLRRVLPMPEATIVEVLENPAMRGVARLF